MHVIKKIGSVLYKWWMLLARGLVFVNTRVILTLFFVIVIGPVALILKILGKDFLERKIDSSPSYWKSREMAEHTLENASRQF